MEDFVEVWIVHPSLCGDAFYTFLLLVIFPACLQVTFLAFSFIQPN
jgi:hypothetical protein